MRHRFLNKPRKRNTPEYNFHCQVADTLDKILNPNLTCWSSIENSNHTGGVPGLIKQGKDKRKGVKSGVPDLFILYDGGSLWLELKSKKGIVSESQELFHLKILNSGNHILVIYSIDDLMSALRVYQVPILIKN